MIAWIKARIVFILVVALLAAPFYAFVLVIALVEGHATIAYYEAVSQMSERAASTNAPISASTATSPS